MLPLATIAGQHIHAVSLRGHPQVSFRVEGDVIDKNGRNAGNVVEPISRGIVSAQTTYGAQIDRAIGGATDAEDGVISQGTRGVAGHKGAHHALGAGVDYAQAV